MRASGWSVAVIDLDEGSRPLGNTFLLVDLVACTLLVDETAHTLYEPLPDINKGQHY